MSCHVVRRPLLTCSGSGTWGFRTIHRYKRLTILVPDFVDGADVRMVQSRGCSCFATESLKSVRIVSKLLRKELQCHESAKVGVFCLVDDTHATTAEFLQDSVVGNGLPDE